MATETATVEAPVTPKPDIRLGATPSARNRADVLAKMEFELGADKAEPAPKAEDKPIPSAADEAKAKPEAPKPPHEDVGDDDEDPDDDKGLERIKREERRMRADLAKERSEFERERETWRADSRVLQQKVDAFEKLAARAVYDPAAVFRALGISEEKYGEMSRQLYYGSPEFLKDPKNKDAAAQYMRQREESDKLRANDERIAKLERERDEERENAKMEKAISQYLDGVVGEVTDDEPMVKHLVEKSPARARSELQQIAEIMHAEGADISPRKVVAMLEAVRRAEAEEDGWDVSTRTKAKTAAKAAEAEKKPAAPATAVNGTAKKADPRSLRDQMVKKLEADDLT